MAYRVRSFVDNSEIVEVWPCQHWQETIGDCENPPTGDVLTYLASNAKFAYQLKAHSKTMTDTNAPGFYKDSNAGRIRNNFMEIEEVTETLQLGDLQYGWNYYTTLQCSEGPRWVQTGWYKYDNPFTPENAGFPYLEPQNFDEEIAEKSALAVTGAFAAVSESDVLGLVCLAESVKTLRGICDLFKQFDKLLTYTHKRVRELKGSRTYKLSDLSDLYMNFRYGVRPLVYDLIGLRQALIPEEFNKRKTYRRGQHIDYTDKDYQFFEAYSHPSGTLKLVVPITRVYEHHAAIRAGVLVQWDSTDRSFGLDRWIESGWELIPYSFIIDWFMNIGDTIISWAPVMGAEILTSWVTVEETITQSLIVGDPFVEGESEGVYSPFVNASGNITKVTTRKTRTPNPPRRWMPQFNLKLDPAKLLDLGIILSNLRKKGYQQNLRF